MGLKSLSKSTKRTGAAIITDVTDTSVLIRILTSKASVTNNSSLLSTRRSVKLPTRKRKLLKNSSRPTGTTDATDVATTTPTTTEGIEDATEDVTDGSMPRKTLKSMI